MALPAARLSAHTQKALATEPVSATILNALPEPEFSGLKNLLMHQ